MAINGTTYSSENIQIIMGNKVVAAAGIEYEESVETQDVHVLGQREPYATINGKGTFAGKVMLIMDEYDALQDSIPKGQSITSVSAFNIIVARLDSTLTLRKDRLNKVKVRKVPKAFKAGENAATIELEISIGSIDHNI